MLQPFGFRDRGRRVSSGADSLSSSSVVTVKQADQEQSGGRRFVSAPITSSGSPEHAKKSAIGYARESPNRARALAEEDDWGGLTRSGSVNSPSGSPRAQRNDANASKRFSLRGSALTGGLYGDKSQPGSPSKRSISSQQAMNGSPSPTKQSSILGRLSSRRVTSTTGADALRSPTRPPLVSNASSPSILGLSSRTIDTYRRDPSELQSSSRQPRVPVLAYAHRQDATPGMAEALQSRTNRTGSPEQRRRAAPLDQTRSSDTQPGRTKSNRSTEKKSMLSRALKRANEAVGLDNAQDYQGAVEAYEEACECLREVMRHSSNSDDRAKLEQIRGTYASRIQELRQADGTWNVANINPREPTTTTRPTTLNKDLPALPRGSPVRAVHQRPTSASHRGTSLDPLGTFWSSDDYDIEFPPQAQEHFSFDSNATEQAPETSDESLVIPGLFDGSAARSRRPSAQASLDRELFNNGENSAPTVGQGTAYSALGRDGPKHEPRPSDTEAAFNAALDAAVEAVYDDGYEPYEEGDTDLQSEEVNSTRTITGDPYVSREAAIAAATAQGLQTMTPPTYGKTAEDYLALGLGDDMGEDERLLEEITRDFMLDNSALDEEAKSVLPRQSDSSTSSSAQTWDSSVASSIQTAGTSLSPVREKPSPSKAGSYVLGVPPIGPPPSSALPPPPASAMPRVPPSMGIDSQSVQDRRVSGSKRLQIRTALDARPSSRANSATSASSSTRQDARETSGRTAGSVSPTNEARSRNVSTIDSAVTNPASSSLMIPTPALSTTLSISSSISTPLSSPTGIRHISGSDRNDLDRNISSVSNNKDSRFRKQPLDAKASSSHETPSTFGVSAGSSSSTKFSYPASLLVHSFLPPPNGQFDFFIDIHRPQGAQALDLPRPLEPCPEAPLLRPFWLLRCIYQTIAHPRGGYLSTKLFIPRHVWKVENVKLKGVDEKVAACDLVTTALARLRKVDTLDADAVLAEMQHLEGVMDQVQMSLNKKLGSDVGSKDLSSMFKDAPASSTIISQSTASFADTPSNTLSTSTTGSSNSATNKSGSTGKSYFSSLGRKLRNKPSHQSLASSFNSTSTLHASTQAAAYTLSTVPMAASPTLPISRQPHGRAHRPNTTSSNFLTPPLSASQGGKPLTEGPYVVYTTALARLCDAAQVLDEIVRQAEDPNLKATGPTHVGLELSARHASEFFGLWVGRWVLGDLVLLVDKYVKRAGEYCVA